MEWFYHLKSQKIADMQDIQPIEVIEELAQYKPRTTKCSQNDWEEIVKKRKKADEYIKKTVEGINKCISSVSPPRKKLITNLENVKSEIKPAESKRLFYESKRENRAKQRFVLIEQIQTNAINTAHRLKNYTFRPMVMQASEGCCSMDFKKVLETLLTRERHNEIPTKWQRMGPTILLALTHFPCHRCLQKIITQIGGSKPGLILRVANIDPHESEFITNWLFQCYQEELEVKLEAINVVDELGRVNCKQNATIQEREEWKEVKKQRKRSDENAIESVKEINKKLCEKIIEEEEIRCMSKVYECILQ